MKTSRTRIVSQAEYERLALKFGDDVPRCDAAEAIRRWGILYRWDIAKRGGWELGYLQKEATARFIQTLADRFGLVVSARNLAYWDKRLRAGGLVNLIDRRSTRSKPIQSRGN